MLGTSTTRDTDDTYVNVRSTLSLVGYACDPHDLWLSVKTDCLLKGQDAFRSFPRPL